VVIKILSKPVMLATFLFVSNIGLGQDKKPGFKTWFDYTVEYNFKKSFTLSFNQILSFNTNPYRLGFIQNDFGFDYRIKRRMYVGAGYVWSLFPDSQSLRDRYSLDPNIIGMLDFNRFYVDYSYKHTFFSKRVLLKHKASFQYFWPQLRKYRYRITYSAKFYFKIRHFPWRGVPFLENKFYIYLDGIPANYYDLQTGEIVATKPPNGLHRYRLKTGVRFRPAKARFYFTPYVFFQREFNTGLVPGNDLNILNPTTNSYSNTFNNYYVVGFNLTYRFKTS
jgi:hypothetical protein